MVSFLECNSSAFYVEFPWNLPQLLVSLDTSFLASVLIIQSFSEQAS